VKSNKIPAHVNARATGRWAEIKTERAVSHPFCFSADQSTDTYWSSNVGQGFNGRIWRKSSKMN
jgi:hypothetical protein